MFLAPCTLPLVPGYLAFIGGGAAAEHKKWNIFWNGFWYVIGFSVVFVFLGSIVGLFGATIRLDQRLLLGRIGGLFIFLFGVFLVGGSQWRFLQWMNAEKTVHIKNLQPGKPLSSFLFGATFAIGWTPCIGPILGSILLLAATSTTVWQGAGLLAVFAMGMGLPFLLLAATADVAIKRLRYIYAYLPIIQKIGGLFLIVLGLCMMAGYMDVWNRVLYSAFGFMRYERLIDFY